MYVKFDKGIDGYRYLVMFDLASKVTGVCLWNIGEDRPERTDIIKVGGTHEPPTVGLYRQLELYFGGLEREISLKDILVSKEAMPIQAGKFTTIQTLVSLAKSHAILELFLYQYGIDSYDGVGVYPASTRAYFKHICPLPDGRHEEKTDINAYVVGKYGLPPISLDESDAVFLAETLIHSKWNRDIDEEIREVKRHRKTLKAAHAIAACDDRISALSKMKTGF